MTLWRTIYTEPELNLKNLEDDEELDDGEMGQEIQANKVELNFSVSNLMGSSVVASKRKTGKCYS